MKSVVVDVKSGEAGSTDLETCSKVVQAGGVLAFPTDTVYGLGCNAFNPSAIAEVYRLKGRSYSKALPVLLWDVSQLELVAKDIPPEVFPLLKTYWPGALTVVLKTAPLALAATRGKSTIAVRIPNHPVTLSILKSAGVPMATTSANRSKKPALHKGDDVVRFFQKRVSLIFDGGDCAIGEASTVLDASHYPFSILRVGSISKKELAERLGLL